MFSVKEFLTHSAEETTILGRDLAALLTPPKLVLLQGDLGSGKTTLVKGIVEYLGGAKRQEVTSPTFNLIHEFHSPAAEIYHIDLYRIDTPRQLETLGIDDLTSLRSLILIEWGEKFERFHRNRDVEIVFERTGENARRIRVTGL